MSKLVHVASKYEIQYGRTAHFNWRIEEMKDALQELHVVIYEEAEFSDTFECDVEEYLNAIELLRDYDNLDKNDEFECLDEYLNNIFVDNTCSEETEVDYKEYAEKFAEILQDFYNEADVRDGYIHFSAW